jgi:hypothetical protein
VLNCETSRESPSPPSDAFPPDDCALAEGVTISLETEDEEALGSCTTDTEGTCTVPVPVWPDGAAPVVVARQQFLTIADGYDPTQSEVRMELMGDDSAAVFVNILIAGSGPFPFPIYAATCEEAPEIVSPFAAAFPPKGCVATEGAIASVALRDGTEIGTCTIDADAARTVDAPFASTVIVTLDEATILNGYTPRQNPITTRVYTEFASAVFLIAPSTTGTPSPAG